MAFWYMVLPKEGTNYHPNPSAELNTSGWSGTGAGANVNRQAGTSRFGAWAFGGTPNGVATGIQGGTAVLPGAGSYTWSAQVFAGSGSVYSIGMKLTAAGGAFVGSTVGTGNGSWQQISLSYGDTVQAGDSASALYRAFAVVRRTAGNDPFFVDGVQVEPGTFQTTYIDGDQDGCSWVAGRHASASVRSGTARQGGTIVPLASLGMTILEMGNTGMPPVLNTVQDYTILDGAAFQRQRAALRPFALTTFMQGTTWPGLHAVRRAVIDQIKVNRTVKPQPVRFAYTGQGGTKFLDAYYDGGMDYSGRNGFTETTAIRFIATDPMWYDPTDQGTALTSQTSLGSVAYLLERQTNGSWGPMTGVSGNVYALAERDGTVFAGGSFSAAGGTLGGNHLAFWHPVVRTWGTLNGTVSGGNVRDLSFSPDGTLFVAGSFAGVAGTAGARYAALYRNGAWGTLTNGTPNDYTNAVLWTPGTIFWGGSFTQVAGTAGVFKVATHSNGRWGSVVDTYGGTLYGGGEVFSILRGGDRGIYFAGNVGSVSGVAARGMVFYGTNPTLTGFEGNTYGTLQGGLTSGTVRDQVQLDDGRIIVGGQLTLAGGNVAYGFAFWSGNNWTSQSRTNIQAYAFDMSSDGADGLLGQFQNISLTDVYQFTPRVQNGYVLPSEIQFVNGSNLRPDHILRTSDGRWIVGGYFDGTATVPALSYVVNQSSHDGYPVVRVKNTGGTTAYLRQLLNVTTGDGLFFEQGIEPGETWTIDLRQGRKSVQSDFQGNLIGAVLPGSKFTNWRLTPGTNTISVLSTPGTVEVSMSWKGRHWSAD